VDADKTRSEWSRWDTAILLGLLTLGVMASFVLGDDFGISWDEGTMTSVGDSALQSFSTLERTLPALEKLSYYGPVFAAVVSWGAGALTKLLPGWEVYDLRHLIYSLCLPVTAVSVFAIGRGLASRVPALLGSGLLLTQPFLVGHAFINPKDVPLMAFFAASVALGFAAARSLPRRRAPVGQANEFPATGLEPALRRRWRAAPGWLRAASFVLLAVIAMFLLDILIFHALVLPSLLAMVGRMYRGDAPKLVQQVFDRQAELRASLPIEAYYQKATGVYGSLVGWLTATLAVVGLAVGTAMYPPRRDALGPRAMSFVVASAILVGLTTSIRVVGPLAGVLVSSLLLIRMRRQAIGWLGLYWLLAGLIAYLTWPLLWTDPAMGFLKSLRFMASFPWNDPVLYRGAFILATELPWDYSLTQTALQLTLPALLLGLGGGLWALFTSRRSPALAEVTLLWLWLIIPYGLAVGGNITLYDGARQLLFAMPPLFVLAAIALQGIFKWVKAPLYRAVVVSLALLPGIVAIVGLHPYEYIYYNEIVGGVGGAARRYELDYWGTGFRQAMEELNRIAPEGASVAVSGPLTSAWPFAREDMVLWKNPRAAGTERPDFQIATSRWNWDLDPTQWHRLAHADWWPEARVVWALERDGAPLVVIKELKRGD